ncbi:MAG TPA: hypothetical protein PKY81_15740 [bacterium]|nr:hypothetical protein [bacterium]
METNNDAGSVEFHITVGGNIWNRNEKMKIQKTNLKGLNFK